METAICLPLLLTMMLAALELCSGYYMKESLTIACFEAARNISQNNASDSDARQICLDILQARNINLGDGTITIEREAINNVPTLQSVSVSISAPSAGNSIRIFDKFASRNIGASVAMAVETDAD